MEPNAKPTAVSKADYARAKKVNRATITRWHQAQRIVLDDDGNVLIAESEARLAETADASKAGVVKRHEVERGQAVMNLEPTSAQTKASTKAAHHEGYGKRITESARREAALADMAEMDRDRQVGKLTDIEGVQKAMVDFATLARQTYERVAFDMKLRLAVEADPDKVFELLKGAIDTASRKVSDTLKAQLDLPGSTRQ